MENSFELLGINSKIENLSKHIEKKYMEFFENISDIALYNQAKVLKAFKDAEISQVHFSKTTGYGYDDIGRDAIEKIYAKIFGAEDSLVRVQFVNGTHTIATALEAMLLPGDRLLAITGKPYDTLCEVIGMVFYMIKLILRKMEILIYLK